MKQITVSSLFHSSHFLLSCSWDVTARRRYQIEGGYTRPRAWERAEMEREKHLIFINSQKWRMKIEASSLYPFASASLCWVNVRDGEMTQQWVTVAPRINASSSLISMSNRCWLLIPEMRVEWQRFIQESGDCERKGMDVQSLLTQYLIMLLDIHSSSHSNSWMRERANGQWVNGELSEINFRSPMNLAVTALYRERPNSERNRMNNMSMMNHPMVISPFVSRFPESEFIQGWDSMDNGNPCTLDKISESRKLSLLS